MSFEEDDGPAAVAYEVPNRPRVGVYANAARISYTLDVLKTINHAMTSYELEFGEIRRPGE